MRLFRHACQKIVQIVEKIQLNSLIFPRTRSVLNNFLKNIISQLRARVGCHFLFFHSRQVGRRFLASEAEILFSIFFSHFFHRENADFTTQMRGKVQGMQISTLITDSFDVRFYKLIYRRVRRASNASLKISELVSRFAVLRTAAERARCGKSTMIGICDFFGWSDEFYKIIEFLSDSGKILASF